jgi:hypothetical protein
VSTNSTIWASGRLKGAKAQWRNGKKTFNLTKRIIERTLKKQTDVPLCRYTVAPFFVPRTGLEPAHHY